MGKKCVAWVLALVLALCGCSAGGGNSVPAGESSPLLRGGSGGPAHRQPRSRTGPRHGGGRGGPGLEKRL